MKLLYVAILVFIINIPFGYWRGNVRKFSFQWALAIHIPVPFVIALRIFSGLGFQLVTYPVLIFSFFFGQYLGKKVFLLLAYKYKPLISSCLCRDLISIYTNKKH